MFVFIIIVALMLIFAVINWSKGKGYLERFSKSKKEEISEKISEKKEALKKEVAKKNVVNSNGTVSLSNDHLNIFGDEDYAYNDDNDYIN